MAKLDETIELVVQRTGGTSGTPRNEAEAAGYRTGIKLDLASIMNQMNSVYYPLFNTLSTEDGLDALDFGLSGNILFTHIQATAADAAAYWDSSLNRQRTIKETIDVLLSEISDLENTFSVNVDVDAYDDTVVRSLIGTNQLNLKQLRLDTMGTNYGFDNDGQADLTYPLSQAVDAIGAFFSGFPGTGNTYAASYPTLSLLVNLSDINIDTTIPQTAVTSLPTDLGVIRAFTGMTDATDNSPTYSAHGSLTNIADGDDLELAIYKLDATLASASGAFDTAANITSNNPGDPTSDDFVFGSTTLDDAGVTAHDNRMLFDKSKGAFRAGEATGTQWDDANRGDNSIAMGSDNIASASGSAVLSGSQSEASGVASVIAGGGVNTTASGGSFIGGGLINSITATGLYNIIVGGGTNSITGTSQASFIGGGGKYTANTWEHEINDSTHAVLVGGGSNHIYDSTSASILGGFGNTIGDDGTGFNSAYSAVVGGLRSRILSTTANADSSFIGGGTDNTITDSSHAIILGGGGTGIGNSVTGADLGAIITGTNNIVNGSGGVIVGGSANTVSVSGGCFMGSGGTVDGVGSVIVNGLNNTNTGLLSFIGGGSYSEIGGGLYNVIVGGGNGSDITSNKILAGGVTSAAFIGGGHTNRIGTTSASSQSAIVAGGANTIDTSTAFIGAGSVNVISLAGSAAIVAGDDNEILNSPDSFIGAGSENIISGSDFAAIVAGGSNTGTDGNTITNSDNSFIGAGEANDIVGVTAATSQHNAILAGTTNIIGDGLADVADNVIVGGGGNQIYDSDLAFIGGGGNASTPANANEITASDGSVIVGGLNNKIRSNNAAVSVRNFIGGGGANDIGTTGGSTTYSSIVGGVSHTVGVGSDYSFIGGGQEHTITTSDFAVIVGGGATGASNGHSITNGNSSFIGGGETNAISGSTHSGVVGGENNVITDSDYSFIGGGGSATPASGNIITAITTGSANTIAGGTNNEINDDTALSHTIGGGGNNTIGDGAGTTIGCTIAGGVSNSINDSSSSVIVGGTQGVINNSDSSFIGAGGLGGTANGLRIIDANYCGVVSGANNLIEGNVGTDLYGFIGGGASNTIGATTIDNLYGVIGGGSSNDIGNSTAADWATIAGGYQGSIEGADYATIGGGSTNAITADYGVIPGGSNNTVDSTYGVSIGTRATSDNYGTVSHASGRFAADGDAQGMHAVWRIQTTDATTNVEGFLDGSSARFAIDSDSTYAYDILVVARRTDVDGESAAYRFEGCIDNNAGTTADVGTVSKTVIAEDTAAWDCQFSADDTNDSLKFDVTGEGSKTINWVAYGKIVKVSG